MGAPSAPESGLSRAKECASRYVPYCNIHRHASGGEAARGALYFSDFIACTIKCGKRALGTTAMHRAAAIPPIAPAGRDIELNTACAWIQLDGSDRRRICERIKGLDGAGGGAGEPGGAWWKRERIGAWLPPLSIRDEGFKQFLRANGWDSGQ